MALLKRIGMCLLLITAAVSLQAAQAQIPQELSSYDFSKVRVDDLSDAQVREILQRARDRGLSIAELEKMAVARGMRPSEVVKFRARLRRLDVDRTGAETEDRREVKIGERIGADEEEKLDPFSVLTKQRKQRAEIEPKTTGSRASRLHAIILNDTTLTAVERDSLLREIDELESLKEEQEDQGPKVFGSDLFASDALTFAPSMNIPTPPDYELGPGDELVVDVWGAAEMTYQLPVTREGTVRVENLGPIFVSGLTVTQAEEKIISRLSQLYSGLNSGSPSEQNMYADVTLGAVRTITVHIIGEVKEPGSYSLPSMSTVFNALYVCHGPSQTGSYRSIKVLRGNDIVAELDVYDFLVYGRQTGNVRLRDQDIVKVDPYLTRVQIEGQVKQPGLFEMRPGETLADLMQFTGGFDQNAYSKRVRVHRETDNERRIVTVERDDFTDLRMWMGDHVFVDEILDRFENRVEIEGAVYRPGQYQLESAKTVYGLIQHAEGLQGDALLSRGQIFRTLPDQTVQLIPFDLGELIRNPPANDISLAREDVVVIPSRLKMHEAYTVDIHGSVQNPGAYPFVHDMTLQDLVVMAGGLKEEASLQRVEVSRRREEADPTTEGGRIADIFQFNIDQDLSLSTEAAAFTLQRFDEVFVRRSPGYSEQRNVQVTGEVLYPGTYTSRTKNDRISDIIERAGGLSPDAYPEGAVLIRTLEDTRFAAGAIGIDLDRILEHPKTSVDLLIEAGDSIHVPQRLETVSVRGAVYYPANIRYRPGLNLMDYINQAGGTTDQADLRRTYVVYASGSVDKIKRTLFLKRYPEIEPGAAIMVPTKPEKEGLSVQERTMIWSSIVSVAAVVSTTIIQIIR